MKRTLILVSCLLLAGLALAQSNAPSLANYPDILTPQIASATALQNYKQVLEGNIQTTFQLGQNNAGVIDQLKGQIISLQNQISSQAAQLTLQAAQIAAIQTQLAGTPPPVTSTTLSWGTMPDGPINGLVGTINYGTGFWQVLGGELAPIADGQPGRSLTFPKPVTITSFTASTTNLASPMIVVSSSAGSMTITFTSTGQDFAASPGWTVPVSTIAMSPSCSGCSALNLRVRQIVYQ